MISMDRPTSGHDLTFFPYFSSILFFFMFLVVFFSLCFFLEIPKLHNHRDMHEERIEPNRGKREQREKGTGKQDNKHILHAMGVVCGGCFFLSPPTRETSGVFC